jgi:hypothetical protein
MSFAEKPTAFRMSHSCDSEARSSSGHFIASGSIVAKGEETMTAQRGILTSVVVMTLAAQL